MLRSIFLTGFPGFIARNLVVRLQRKAPYAAFSFLVEERLRGAAEGALDSIGLKAELLTGDITLPDLGLRGETYQATSGRTTHVWHLAALYDLAAPLARAYRVNVIGTANVLDFAERCPKLERFDYVSTCYVCGIRTGRVLESELDEGQSFKNHYESTKCWAEMEVRRRMHRIPATIYRPSIVVGDSKTGQTEKYDGPYYVMQFLNRLPRWLPLVHIGPGCEANLVPVDFVVDAMAHVWTLPRSLGKTVHLADPKPHSTREVMSAMARALGFREPIGAVPLAAVASLMKLRLARDWARLPAEALAYFDADVRFDTTHQRQLLEESDVTCPSFEVVLPALLRHFRKHPTKLFLDQRAF